MKGETLCSYPVVCTQNAKAQCSLAENCRKSVKKPYEGMWIVALQDTSQILWSWWFSLSTVVFDCLWSLWFLSPSHCSINFVYLIFRIFFVNYAYNSWAMWTTIWYVISYKDDLIALWLLHRKISCGVVRAWNQWLNLKQNATTYLCVIHVALFSFF